MLATEIVCTVTKFVVIVVVVVTGDGKKVVTIPLDTVVVEESTTGDPVIVWVEKTSTESRVMVLAATSSCLRRKVFAALDDGTMSEVDGNASVGLTLTV